MKQEEIIIVENVSEIREQNVKRKRRAGVVVGIIINILALIGILTIVIISISAISNMFTQNREKDNWTEFILPVVMVNPQEFQNANDIPAEDARLIAIWASLMTTDLNTLNVDQETNYLMIPESEVAKHASTIFGRDYILTHTSVDAPDVSYRYDSEQKAYLIKDYDKDVNTPYIRSIEKTEIGLKLAVGYLPPALPWQLNSDGSRKIDNPEKYMYYYIEFKEKLPYIKSIELATDLNEAFIEAPLNQGEQNQQQGLGGTGD